MCMYYLDEIIFKILKNGFLIKNLAWMQIPGFSWKINPQDTWSHAPLDNTD